jgi:hypothetical protein
MAIQGCIRQGISAIWKASPDTCGTGPSPGIEIYPTNPRPRSRTPPSLWKQALRCNMHRITGRTSCGTCVPLSHVALAQAMAEECADRCRYESALLYRKPKHQATFTALVGSRTPTKSMLYSPQIPEKLSKGCSEAAHAACKFK